jgi:hypothetical protein
MPKSHNAAMLGRRMMANAALQAQARRRAVGVPAQVPSMPVAPQGPIGQALTGVTQDLNKPGNRSPATPNQEDINSWKSKPVTTRGKWMSNSQGKGTASDSGVGKTFKGQPKFGGTQAGGSNKKGEAKVTGGTQAPGKTFKGQEKFSKRYANGSDSHDTLKGMIRDH